MNVYTSRGLVVYKITRSRNVATLLKLELLRSTSVDQDEKI